MSRYKIYLAHLGQSKGQEQGGKRPCLIVSDSVFNENAARLVTVLPITTRRWELPWHVPLAPEQSGLDRDSFVMCDQVRTITAARLLKPIGHAGGDVLDRVEERLRFLLGL